LRSGWKQYEKCYSELNATKDNSLTVDRSVRGGIGFGIGSFNTFVRTHPLARPRVARTNAVSLTRSRAVCVYVQISLMPPIVLRIVSALGFPSDRARGLEE